MTVQEFSDQFDILVNVYLHLFQFGEQDPLQFNEYEKSVFLTKAQYEYVISCYDGKNQSGYLFEHTEEDRRILDSLIKTIELSPMQSHAVSYIRYIPLSNGSYFFKLPKDLMFITYESCNLKSDDKCIDGSNVIVVPTTLDELKKVINNPFRNASNKRVLRLDYNGDYVELISKYGISKYIIRYISKPSPIILVDLPDGLEIDSISSVTECKLADFTHRQILDYAVRLALLSRSIGFNNK